jgi:hypothetical protein
MASKLNKVRIKRKPGRPLKKDMARTETGQISRAKNPGEPADKVAKEARMKMYDLPAETAALPQAATVIGRLSLLGQQGGGISIDQYDALVRFSMERERYMKAVMAPDSLVNAGSGGASCMDEESDTESRLKAANRYDSARSAIQNSQNENRGSNLWSVIQHIVIGNLDFPHMYGDLRLVGNALNRHYQGLDRKRKAA